MPRFERIVLAVAVAALLPVASPALAVVGQTVITSNGEPIPSATVTLETVGGDPLTTAQTDDYGVVLLELPDAAEDRQVTVTVEDKDGNTTQQTATVPGGGSRYMMAMDTAGGIVMFPERAIGHIKDAATPIIVGENAEVGSGARMTEKVKETAGSLFGSALSGLLGGGSIGPSGGDGSDGGEELETTDDPVSDDAKRVFTDPVTGTKIAVGAQLGAAGLLISTSIVDSDDNGTFQTVYLMDTEGRRAGPTRYDIYEIYQAWTLIVSWTHDRWVDGQHVEHREGGWSEDGRNILGNFAVPQREDGIWGRMGFSNASHGIQGLGAFFPVKRELLQSQPMILVVHVTRPSQDTVTTTPFVIGIATPSGMSGSGPRPPQLINMSALASSR